MCQIISLSVGIPQGRAIPRLPPLTSSRLLLTVYVERLNVAEGLVWHSCPGITKNKCTFAQHTFIILLSS